MVELEQEIFLHKSPPLLLCIFIGFLLHSVVEAEIPLGSKLSVVDNDYWVSSNGDFAFGFFNISDQPNQFSIGIHFNSKSIPYSQQTVVWVAGADVTVGNMSYFELNQEGDLVLFDSLQQVSAWTSGTRNQPVVSVSLLDNGNLVLMDTKKNIIWQSFDNPSDTLVPGQSLSVKYMLRAAAKNQKSSYYTLHMNASGHLELLWENSVIYWKTEGPSAANLSAFLTTSGAFELRDRSLKPVWSVFGDDHNDSVSYRYLRLDVDGNLRLYSWVEALQSWRTVWKAVENQCKVFATCGQLGICVFNASGSANCVCPFEVTRANKCLVPYEKDCESGTSMMQYENTHLYGIYPPDDSVVTSSLQHCQQLCLNDSLCTVATFSNNGTPQCSIKKTEYVTGYGDPSVSSISFVKKCSGPFAVNPGLKKSPPSEPQPPSKLCVPCLTGAATGTFFIIVILQLGIGFYIYKRKHFTRKKDTLAFARANSNGLIVLSFSEIKSLTGDFNNQIGPKMFKGSLPNNRPIAVKDLNTSIEERKFRSAVLKMSSIHHKNLLKLEGYCCELDHRFLVYEYAKNGSVDKYIDDSALCKKLTWRKRVEICSSVAKAIGYLHTECREFISHGNLKCENVMLNEDLEAKVSEFGFARVDGKATYCGFSAEKDVEDFGKLVLTLLTGCRRDHDHMELCEWAYKEWMEERVGNVVDKRMEGGYNSEELEGVLRIAFWCLQRDERKRPSMVEVVRVLDGVLSVDPPPPPFGFQKVDDDDDLEENVSESEV